MKKTLTAVALFLSLAAGGSLAVTAAQAQSAERVYENGTVWRVTAVETKPGMLNDYMKYLSGPWRAILEAGKKSGDVVSYRVMAVDAPRDHEPNLFLVVEYKNMAVFDRSLKDFDTQSAGVFGSTDKAQQAAVARETMRVSRGQTLLREYKFTD
jgi:hypothetical protein